MDPSVLRDERCGPGEPGRSYAQILYEPPVPSEDRLRSSTLLVATLEHEGVSDRLLPMCVDARTKLGLERTVFGVKAVEGRVSWEFYWYQHSLERPLTLDTIRSVVEPHFGWPSLQADANAACWSLSIDIDEAVLSTGEIGGVHLYEPQPTVPASCFSYGLTPVGSVPENTYYLFTGRGLRRESAAWLASAPYGRSALEVLRSVAGPVDHVATAIKPDAIGLYVGGLAPRTAARLLADAGTPAWLAELLESPGGSHDHLLIDVGWNVANSGGSERVTKTAFHGVV